MSEGERYERQRRRPQRFVGPQLGMLKHFQKPDVVLATEFMRRHHEQFKLFANAAVRRAMAPLLMWDEHAVKSLTAGTPSFRLVDTKALESLKLLNQASLSVLSKSGMPGITAAMRGLYDFRQPLINEQLRRTLAGFREAWRRSLPSNWEAHDGLGEVEAIVDLMEATGWCLVWAPRWSVIETLLACEPEAREAALHEHEEEILADLESCLAGVQGQEVEDLKTAAAQAILAYRSEAFIPAQAAATVVLTDAIHVHFRLPRFLEAREKFEEDAMEVGIQRFRLQAILRVAWHALAEFHGTSGESIPVKFNRHASAHRVSPAQFNRTNALAALMLVVPLVRELDIWLAHAPDEDEEAA